MAYVIGVSTGLWGIAQGEEKEQYMTMMKKIFWGGFKGVNFSQVDIDTVNEFDEPFVDEGIKRIESLGMQFGIHAETSATTGSHTMALESAIFDEYWRAHERLIQHINGSGRVKAKYLLTHASELTPIPILAMRELQSTKLCDPWGRPMSALLEENSNVVDWALSVEIVSEILRLESRFDNPEEILEKEVHIFKEKNDGKEPGEDWKVKRKKELEDYIRKKKEEFLKGFVDMRSQTYGSERLAYLLVGKWMELSKDSFWISIVGDQKLDKIHDKYEEWVPAVAAKYVWGHFNPLPASEMNLKKELKEKGITHSLEDPKPLLEKFKIIFVFEPQMAQLGFEKHMRLHKITDIYWLVKNIPSKFVGIAFDIEHTLSGGSDPMKLVDKLPPDGGKAIKVMHVGWPTPHVPAHVPIYLGSEAQEYIYEILYKLKKKGFDEKEDRWIIFERGGGQDPIKDSVQSLRKIVEYLSKEVPPDPKNLPEDFYGVGTEGPEIARQFVTMKEHALDPLKGVLHVPEEEFGFLSTGVAQKGKLEEWKKEKLR